MGNIAIVTDSNSGITQAQSRELGVFVLPMPFYINDELFLEDITLSQEQFYRHLAADADVKTTQPRPGGCDRAVGQAPAGPRGRGAYSHVQRSEQLLRDCPHAGPDYDGR